MSEQPEVLDETRLATGKFLELQRLNWRDGKGVERQWETAERVDDHGAVLIIGWLRPSDRLLMIRQFRPPARRFVYEFPAGLIDAGETAEAAARRELREETGYSAAAVFVMPPAYTSPGMSSEAVNLVAVEINEDAPQNEVIRTQFDPSENIETILVPAAEVTAFYRRECDAGNAFDAKLAAYITAMVAPRP